MSLSYAPLKNVSDDTFRCYTKIKEHEVGYGRLPKPFISYPFMKEDMEFKKGDKIKYKTPGRMYPCFGIFSSYGVSYDRKTRQVWGYWDGSPTVSWIEEEYCSLVESKKQRKLPEWF